MLFRGDIIKIEDRKCEDDLFCVEIYKGGTLIAQETGKNTKILREKAIIKACKTLGYI